MNYREKLKQSVKKGGLSNDELHHPSRAYERHFEGYEETVVPIPGKKRTRAVRTYVDAIWVRQQSRKQRILTCILYVVLFLASLPPFLYSATRMIDSNTVWYVTLPQAAALLALAWTALNLYRHCTLPKEMTVRQHRQGVLWLRRTSCAAWIALATDAAAYLLHGLIFSESAALPCALFTLLSCLCMLALFLVERAVPCIELPNPNAHPE